MGTVWFFLLGWIWSIMWGAAFLGMSGKIIYWFNPRLTKLFFVTRLTKGFPNRTPYEIDFGISG